MTDSDLDGVTPELLERAAMVARANGMAGDLHDLADADWERLLGLIAQSAAEAGAALPNGWQEGLGRYRQRERLRADTDDADLAARGEVFGREDDA